MFKNVIDEIRKSDYHKSNETKHFFKQYKMFTIV